MPDLSVCNYAGRIAVHLACRCGVHLQLDFALLMQSNYVRCPACLCIAPAADLAIALFEMLRCRTPEHRTITAKPTD